MEDSVVGWWGSSVFTGAAEGSSGASIAIASLEPSKGPGGMLPVEGMAEVSGVLAPFFSAEPLVAAGVTESVA